MTEAQVGVTRPGVFLQLTTPCPARPPPGGEDDASSSPLPGLDGSALQRQPRWWAQGRGGRQGAAHRLVVALGAEVLSALI